MKRMCSVISVLPRNPTACEIPHAGCKTTPETQNRYRTGGLRKRAEYRTSHAVPAAPPAAGRPLDRGVATAAAAGRGAWLRAAAAPPQALRCAGADRRLSRCPLSAVPAGAAQGVPAGGRRRAGGKGSSMPPPYSPSRLRLRGPRWRGCGPCGRGVAASVLSQRAAARREPMCGP